MSIKESFDNCVNEINNLPDGESPLTNAEKLTMYGLFKQAKFGDVNTNRPGIFDMTGRAKWDAWKSREGMDREEAMIMYCEEYLALKDTYNF